MKKMKCSKCPLIKKSKPALLIVASHDIEDANKDIDVSKCVVNNYYSSGTWRDGNGISLKNITDSFLSRYGGSRYTKARRHDVD